MIKQLFLVALIAVSLVIVIAGLTTITTHAYSQNVTSENTTAANSTTFEERGAYSDYGGGE
jgi:Tfp pilus assembly protein PilE